MGKRILIIVLLVVIILPSAVYYFDKKRAFSLIDQYTAERMMEIEAELQKAEAEQHPYAQWNIRMKDGSRLWAQKSVRYIKMLDKEAD